VTATRPSPDAYSKAAFGRVVTPPRCGELAAVNAGVHDRRKTPGIGARLPTYWFMRLNNPAIAAWFVVIE